MIKLYLLIILFILLLNILFGILYYNETLILLTKKNNLNDTSVTIKKHILPRNLIPIKNKYEIIKDTYDYSDFSIIIYWINNYYCQIKITRLDDDIIINPFSVCIYNLDNTTKININFKENNTNEIILNYKTLFELDKINLNYEQTIPKIIIQTTKTNTITKACYSAINTFIDLNPEYEYRLYDDNDCIEFIKNHYDNDVLDAYNNLIPGAYKADLFRYCVLYITGGCYFDIKQILREPLRNIIDKNDKIILTEDNNPTAYYNATMLLEKNNPLMLTIIKQVVINVKNKYYGNCPLCPTGPCLLYNITNHIKPKFYYKPTINELLFYQLRSKASIKYNNKPIINITYYGYYNYNLKNHYSYFWKIKNIYFSDK